jgi:hypothetical protein
MAIHFFDDYKAMTMKKLKKVSTTTTTGTGKESSAIKTRN